MVVISGSGLSSVRSERALKNLNGETEKTEVTEIRYGNDL